MERHSHVLCTGTGSTSHAIQVTHQSETNITTCSRLCYEYTYVVIMSSVCGAVKYHVWGRVMSGLLVLH